MGEPEGDEIPVNAGIPTNGIVEDKVIVIFGVYTITRSVRFVNCQFVMNGGSGIVFHCPAFSAQVEFDGCHFFGCGRMWQGISTTGSIPNPLTPAGICDFYFHDCELEDAHTGLSLDEGIPVRYSILNNKFRNNYIGVANQRQTYLNLNAVFVGNDFWGDTDLLPPMSTSYAHVGIQLDNVTAKIGALNMINQQNSFHCLDYGIHAINSNISVGNNLFFNFEAAAGAGVRTIDGSAKIEGCSFSGAARHFIEAEGANLTVLSSTFENTGANAPMAGIYSHGNAHGELIRIGEPGHSNSFTMTDDRWEFGIRVERTAAPVTKISCQIKYNDFVVSGDQIRVSCIYVEDAITPAPDLLRVAWNSVDATGSSNLVNGVAVAFSESKRYLIDNNSIGYNGSSVSGWGITLNNTLGKASPDNLVSTNHVSGNPGSHSCSVHCEKVNFADFCENTVDGSTRGLHFVAINDVALRENHMNYHQFGIQIEKQVGRQLGRGNTWLEDPDACTDYAIQITSNGNPQNSIFRVTELDTLPFMPPNGNNGSVRKIDPDPLDSNSPNFKWFDYQAGLPLDHCDSITSPRPVRLTISEQAEVDSTSGTSGVFRWDLQRSAYFRMLADTSLRPSGSAEETWYNSFSGSNIANFSQIEKDVMDALAFPLAQEQQLDSARTVIEQSWTDLDHLDTTQTFSAAPSTVYFAQHDSLLGIASAGIQSERNTESSRQGNVTTALQSALAANAAIVAVQAYETAQKQVNDFRIRRLLGEPLTQAAYEQMLALTQESEYDYGRMVSDVKQLLAPCDRDFIDLPDEYGEKATSLQSIPVKRNTLRLHPNPSSGWVTVSMKKRGVGIFRVLDLYGRLVLEQRLTEPSTDVQLDLRAQSAGIYKIVFVDASGKATVASFALTR